MQPSIYSATLGLSHPWQVTGISFAKDGKRLDITVDYADDGIFTCPTCRREVKECEMQIETWYHDNFFRYATYLHARVPQIDCCCCGLLPVERPWSRAGSKFILLAS